MDSDDLIVNEIGGIAAQVRELTDDEYDRPRPEDKIEKNVWERGPEWKKV